MGQHSPASSPKWHEIEVFRVLSKIQTIEIQMFWTLVLGERGSYDLTSVSMSVGKHVFPKIAHRIFLKLHMKLGYLKDEKLIERVFEKKSHIGDNAQKHSVFWANQKKIQIDRFFGFKSCTIITFMILLKLHVWEKSGS